MAPEKNRGDGDPFGKLQSYTNAVLIKSGRLFQDPRKRDGRNMLAMRRELKKTLPSILASYHDVLDSFDTELQLAQRALRAELDTRKRERLQKERAEEALKRKAAQPPPPAKPAPAMSVTNRAKGPGKSEDDVIMLDGPTAGGTKVANQLYTDQGKPQENIAKSAPGAKAQDKKRAMPEAIKIPSPKAETADGGIDLTSASAFDDLFEGKTPTTANRDMDLDSIFNDTTTVSGDPMNVSGDVSDIDFNFANETADSSGGASSLLPGLENYSNMGNDMSAGDGVSNADFHFDMPANNTSANIAGPQNPGGDQPSSTGDDNLDDLLFGLEYSADGAGLSADTSQFDDFWGQ